MLKRLISRTSRINRTLALTLAAAMAVTTAFADEETDYEKSVVINGRTWTFQSWDWDIESTEGIRVSGVSPATGDIVIPSSAVIDGFEYDVVGIIGTWQEGEDEEGQIIGAFENCTEMTSLTIPASITEIGDRQFLGCTGLKKFIVDPDNEYYASTSDGLLLGYAWSDSGMVKNGRLVTVPAALSSVTIPNSVIMIEGGAFAGCSKLKSITIPNSVTTIYDDAFMDCTGLTGTFTIPSSVTMIDGSAFRGCFGITAFAVESGNPCYTAESGVLMSQDGDTITVEAVPKGRTSYTVPAGVTKIGYGAFQDSKLETISLPEGLVFISDYAFKGCSNLKSISLPSTVESVGFGTFAKCTALTSFTIPRDLSWLGHGAFSGCTNLKSFTVEEGNETYSADAGLLMSADGSSVMTVPCGMESVIIPEGVTFIDWQAALNCNLTTLSLPESLTSIDGYSFRGCKNLKSVRVPDNVEYISWMAFANCTSLKNVSLPSTITEEQLIYEEVFYGCPDDIKIVFRSAPQYTLSADPSGGVLSGSNFGTADGKNTTGKVKVTVGSTEYNTLGVARKSGYTFNGWFTAKTGGTKVYDAKGEAVKGDYWSATGSAATWKYDGDVSLYAQWTLRTYTLTLDPNGGTYNSKTTVHTIPNASQTTKPTYGKTYYWRVGAATRTGYTFKGWYDVATGKQVYDAKGEAVKGDYWSATGSAATWKYDGGDVSLYAQWTPKTYTLTLDPNGGTYKDKTTAHTIPNATQTTKPTYGKGYYWRVGAATRTGYTFNGWFTAKTGGTKVFDAKGEAVKGDYWSAAGSTATWKYDGNVTVYAQWTPVGPKTYTLTLDPNGGTYKDKTAAHVIPNASQTTKPTYGKTYYWRVGDATRTGYTFKGWYDAETGGKQVYNAKGEAVKGDYWSASGNTATWIYNGNVTLYAQWTAKAYTLTLDPKGGTYNGKTTAHTIPNASQTTKPTYGKTYYWRVGAATRTGYTFKGWYTAGGKQVYNAKGEAVKGDYWSASGSAATWKYDGNVSLYAQWTAKTYTLTLDPNGGTYKNKTTAHTIPNASQTAKPTYATGNYWRVGAATRTGYTFKGWYTATTGGKQVYNANGEAVKGDYWSATGSTAKWIYDGNVSLYAQWTKISASAPLSKALSVSEPTRADSATMDGVAYLPSGESFPVEVRVDVDGFAVVELEDAIFWGYIADGSGELVCANGMHLVVFLAEP